MAESTIAGTSALQLKNSDKDNGKIASQSSTSLCTLPGYWTVSEGVANRTGWSCRECKAYIKKGAEITVRDGSTILTQEEK